MQQLGQVADNVVVMHEQYAWIISLMIRSLRCTAHPQAVGSHGMLLHQVHCLSRHGLAVAGIIQQDISSLLVLWPNMIDSMAQPLCSRYSSAAVPDAVRSNSNISAHSHCA
jgi:hypothetical protein